MKLLHHPEVELSRHLLAALPEGAEVIEGDGGHAVSAFPPVVVAVPAHVETRPAFNEAGERIGVEPVEIPTHEQVLRLPASWEAVQASVDFVTARAGGLMMARGGKTVAGRAARAPVPVEPGLRFRGRQGLAWRAPAGGDA